MRVSLNNVSNTRLKYPKISSREIIRNELIDTILSSQKKFTYIHAGAGYGKTTLLSQIADSSQNAVWFSIAGENDIFTFVDVLSKSIAVAFPEYEFAVSEYIPFGDNENFIILLANAIVSSIERLSQGFTLILDDIHTIRDQKTRELIACIIKYIPGKIHLCIGSREAPWQELMPFSLRGSILIIGQNKLSFNRDEAFEILGIQDESIYSVTEGWPLALNSFRLLLEDGVAPAQLPSLGNEALYSYLFYEYVNRLPSEMVSFLKLSACFDELDTLMIDNVLEQYNSKAILESLVDKNIFTAKTSMGHYRYHALFREGLLENCDLAEKKELQYKAALYYYGIKDYEKSAEYAIKLNNKALLQKIIISSYKSLLKKGNYNKLSSWFQVLDNDAAVTGPEILIAKGAFLSSIGNFTEAKISLDAAIPLLKDENTELYLEAMVHKARVLRNFNSFDASTKLLDELIDKLENLASETAYAVVIEKLYNLCWNSQINEAYSLANKAVEHCSRLGNLKVRAWYERYMCAVYFFGGRMKEAVSYYEKSLDIPEDEAQYLDIHGIGIYAAKAYQMLGDNIRALSVLNDELKKMRTTGKYEEMWSGYLFAAEIHFQNTAIDKTNGKNTTYETTMKYFTLADEYAPLYRKTEYQMQWAKMQQLTYSLMFTKLPKEDIISEILSNLDSAGYYLKSIILARLYGFFAAVSDYENAVKYSKLCIEIGEKSNMFLHSTLAYGILARAAIKGGNYNDAVCYTQRYITLCSANGIYAYFMARKDYDPVLEFASVNGIEPELTKELMDFAGYKLKKAYIKTFGGFTVFRYGKMDSPIKMRTKKERELFAFILDSGAQGVTKEDIYNALWSESESDNIKKVIGVNLSQIKKDLSCAGIENPIICKDKRYIICRDEIECDFELFEEAVHSFEKQRTGMDSEKLLSLYIGEYLSDFEAFWATAKRLKYEKYYQEAVEYTLNSVPGYEG